MNRDTDYIRLSATPKIGSIGFSSLIRQFRGDAGEAISWLEREKGIKAPSKSYAEAQLKKAEHCGAHLVLSCDKDYPPMLLQTEDRPPFLWVLGDVAALGARMVGVVGSRNASLNARNFAGLLSRQISAAGFSIASGMAIGIDTAAHNGALDADNGKTVAVLAGGADILYPPSNRALYERLKSTKGCAVVSDMPLGTDPAAKLFVRRNRIVAGMSEGVIIAEASLRSGSLTTARFAADYSRDVFAVPNFPLDPRAHGCNDLIKNGAALCDGSQEVIDALGPSAPIRPPEPEFKLMEASPGGPSSRGPTPVPEEIKHQVLENLSSEPISVNSLLRAMPEFSQASISAAILELEITGRLVHTDSGLVLVL